jgi:dihydroorotate dehydrogenase (fumarate)
MNLATRYLGLDLPHPLVCGASPLADELDGVRRLEEGGIAAIVLRSLFEEQLEDPRGHRSGAAEAAAHAYAEHVRKVRAAVRLPVVASLNGTTLGGWLAQARLVEQAGAHAIELNAYRLVTDPGTTSRDVEEDLVEMVRAVCDAVLVPVAVKLSPFYSALPNLAQRLEAAGAEGLVIFNRFYQADIDLEALAVHPELHLSDSKDLLLRLRWLAILRPLWSASLAVTGGVHDAGDVVKAVVCGADAVQIVSTLLRHGPARIGVLLRAIEEWLAEHDVEALSDLQSALSVERCPEPELFERAQYLDVLRSWRPHRRRD